MGSQNEILSLGTLRYSSDDSLSRSWRLIKTLPPNRWIEELPRVFSISLPLSQTYLILVNEAELEAINPSQLIELKGNLPLTKGYILLPSTSHHARIYAPPEKATIYRLANPYTYIKEIPSKFRGEETDIPLASIALTQGERYTSISIERFLAYKDTSAYEAFAKHLVYPYPKAFIRELARTLQLIPRHSNLWTIITDGLFEIMTDEEIEAIHSLLAGIKCSYQLTTIPYLIDLEFFPEFNLYTILLIGT